MSQSVTAQYQLWNNALIKSVVPEYAEQLSALHCESFGDTGWSISQVLGSLALDTTVGSVAFEGDRASGFIFCQLTPEQCEILTFCVTPSLRRQKIGEHLVQNAITLATEKGCTKIFLEVADDNEPAQKLYKKLGFKLLGKRPQYYKRGSLLIDALTFELTLFASRASSC